MTDPRFFKRVWKVTAYRTKPGTPGGFISSHDDYFEPLPNGIEITKMRVQFEVEKTLNKTPNQAKVTITNLAEGTRGDIVKLPLIVRIEAGHEENGGARLLFQGDLRYGFSKRRNTDWDTELEVGDASRAYAEARVSRSYARGTSVLTVLRDAASTMGLKLPKEIDASAELQKQFAAGVQLYGPSRDELTRLLAPFGYGWSIQDGRLQILKDEDLLAGREIVISQATGMLADPEFGSPPKKGKPPTLTIKTILYPQVSPGVMLNVQSDGVNGIFRAERVRHVGDSHGDDWTTEIEAKAHTP